MTNVVRLHTDKRWRADIEYRTDNGVADVEHFFEEIEDLHAIIEAGPHWSCIIKCTVTLNRNIVGFEDLTVEEAAKL